MPESQSKQSMDKADITGLVLAGGRARRMGGIDKGLVKIQDRTMCEIAVELLRPQVMEVLVNANRNKDVYAQLGCKIVEDELDGFLGPLAGLVSGMKIAGTSWIITAPCDCPFLSEQYVSQMAAYAKSDIDIVVAFDGERMQPTFMMVRCELRDSLLDFLNSGGRKIDLWFIQHRYATADCSSISESFVNINTPEEKDAAELRVAGNGKQ